MLASLRKLQQQENKHDNEIETGQVMTMPNAKFHKSPTRVNSTVKKPTFANLDIKNIVIVEDSDSSAENDKTPAVGLGKKENKIKTRFQN